MIAVLTVLLLAVIGAGLVWLIDSDIRRLDGNDSSQPWERYDNYPDRGSW